ncbi:MAG TPA: 30S ribosomal protein S16 [candidate division Zixibacteria bacterium]|nr:30S ribosomal protein S16 [candidate division Zixibacteria bacterium]
MAVRIRLTRVGATKRPSYRVVAIDSRRPRDGRALEILGYYNPLTDPATVHIDADKVRAWLSKGATPSRTVVKLMRQAGMAEAGPAPASTPRAKAAAKRGKEAAAEAGAPAVKAPAPAAGAPVEASAEPAEASAQEEAPAEAERSESTETGGASEASEE